MKRFPGKAALARAREDIEVVRAKDPAVTSTWEVLLYPHLQALWLHRLAHRLYRRRKFVLARAIAMFARAVSGIDIHPGARIGRRFFIDHGAGVVIGETVEIGDDVMLYHLVTLGSVGWWRDFARTKGAKRHPTLGDGVVLGTAAAVLGPVVVGSGSIVGAHAVVLRSLPVQSRVAPGRVVQRAAVAEDRRLPACDTAPWYANGECSPDEYSPDDMDAHEEARK